MASSEITPVSWPVGSPVSSQKLQTMADNIQILNDKIPSMVFAANGLSKSKNIKVFVGNTVFKPLKAGNQAATIYFGNLFSPGCNPMIALGVNGKVQSRYHANYQGLGGDLWADHRGCIVSVQPDETDPKNNYFRYTFYVNVIAIGW